MESDGIITRTVYPEVPVRVEYALSELGDTMRPIINSMFEWGTMYQGLVKEWGFRKIGKQAFPEAVKNSVSMGNKIPLIRVWYV